MRVVQICYHLTYGDGVSNCILALSQALDDLEFDNIIAVKKFNSNTEIQNVVIFHDLADLQLKISDVIFYHFHSGGVLNREVEALDNKKVLVYQNITPPHFFVGIDVNSAIHCLYGQADAQRTRDYYLRAIVMSKYNKEDLVRMGWREDYIHHIPLIKESTAREYVDINTENKSIIGIQADYVNILFVGRIAPNKKIEDLIGFINYYEKNVNSRCRLILIGGKPYKNYYEVLQAYTKKLGCDSVLFANHVSDEELLAYYKNSDLFLCMSEHEGFCIPIIEAMQQGIPVVAYASSAVKETVGDAGVLFANKDFALLADIVQRILNDNEYRNEIIEKQFKHAEKMCLRSYMGQLLDLLEEIDNIQNYKYKDNSFQCQDYYLDKGINCEVLNHRYDAPIVIYGAGLGGKTLYNGIKDQYNVVAFCDNGSDKKNMDLPVYAHDECIHNFKEAIYIISIQKRPMDVMARLVLSGIDTHNIYMFRLLENVIE